MEPLGAPPPPPRDVDEGDAQLTCSDRWGLAPRALAAACSVLIALVLLDRSGQNDGGGMSSSANLASQGATVLSPQCTAPYEELGIVRDSDWCAAFADAGTSRPGCIPLRDWRQMNEQPRRAHVSNRLWTRCDQSRALGGQSASGSTRTDVGGGNWYRFTSVDQSGARWDSLPTQPVRAGQDGLLSRQHNQASAQGITGACGADATAWVSGWPADRAAGLPPMNYSGPGSLPGDGPQYFPDTDSEWQDYVVCFEGVLPVANENPVSPPVRPPRDGPRQPMVSGVLYELWRDVSGSKVTDLGASDLFPDNPTERRVIGGRDNMDIHTVAEGDGIAYFESPTDIGEHLGTRMRAYFRAPEDGCYTFVIATDDDGELWLGDVLDSDGGTETPRVNAASDTCSHDIALELMASVPGWTSPRGWDKYPQQVSSSVALRMGQFVLLDAFAKENEGGDNLAVAATLPSGQFLGPIPIREYLFLDENLLGIARTPLAAPSANAPTTTLQPGEVKNYHTCLASVRVRAVHCGSFLLCQLPDVPSCEPLAMGYCTVPSGLFDV